MNVVEGMQFLDDRPSVVAVKKTDKSNIIAVGLKEGQWLKKHKALIPTMLLMLDGAIEFRIDGKQHHFKTSDTFEIPVGIEHEVQGLTQAVFVLIQEK